jgi:hypothetical protein
MWTLSFLEEESSACWVKFINSPIEIIKEDIKEKKESERKS